MKTSKLHAPLFSMLMVVLSAAAAGCGISVEAEVPEIEVTQRNLAFTGIPLGGLLGDVSMTRSFSQKHTKLDLPEGLDTEVKALSVSLVAKSGITDFSFVHNLRLTMTDGQHPAVELINYEQTSGNAGNNVLTMQSANPVNTLDQWKTESATFTLEIAGSLPEQDWSVDLAIRFAGKVKYTY